MEENQLISENQSGFRQRHSCETALNLVISHWKSEMNEGNCIAAVFLDFKRAFETIDRSILIEKMKRYGIDGVENQWFGSYLSNRWQRTKVAEGISEPAQITLGVPQGAVLGTLLFLIYINDMENILQGVKICQFADDTLLYTSGKSSQECIARLNYNLKVVFNYVNMNKLKLNVKKTKAIVINGESEDNIIVNDEIIDKVDEIKYLGIVIDKS